MHVLIFVGIEGNYKAHNQAKARLEAPQQVPMGQKNTHRSLLPTLPIHVHLMRRTMSQPPFIHQIITLPNIQSSQITQCTV